MNTTAEIWQDSAGWHWKVETDVGDLPEWVDLSGTWNDLDGEDAEMCGWEAAYAVGCITRQWWHQQQLELF